MKPNLYVFFAISALVFCLVLIKAITQPLIYDEATTYFLFVSPDIGGFPWVTGSAIHSNNHLAYTFSLKVLTLLGNAKWILRLPSIIAFPLMIWGILRLTRGAHYGVRIAALLALSNPFFLEFFSLARGYAPFISILVFVMADIKLLLESYSVNRLLKINALLALACAFYLGGLPVAVAVNAVLLYFSILHRKWTFHLLIGLIYVPLILYGIALSEANQLYFGSNDLGRTWETLVLYFSNNHSLLLFTALCSAGLLGILNRIHLQSRASWLILLCALCIVIVQHYLLSTPWPVQRTLIPYLILVLCIVLVDQSSYSRYSIALFALISLFTVSRYSLNYVSIEYWKWQQVPPEFVEIIQADDAIPIVGGTKHANLSYMYELEQNDADLKLLYNHQADDYSALNWVIAPFYETRNMEGFQQVKKLESGLCLLKNKTPITECFLAYLDSPQELDFSDNPHLSASCTEEAIPLFTLVNQPFEVGIVVSEDCYSLDSSIDLRIEKIRLSE